MSGAIIVLSKVEDVGCTERRVDVYPNGNVKYMDEEKRETYKSSQLLSILHLQLQGWRVTNPTQWKEYEV